MQRKSVIVLRDNSFLISVDANIGEDAIYQWYLVDHEGVRKNLEAEKQEKISLCENWIRDNAEKCLLCCEYLDSDVKYQLISCELSSDFVELIKKNQFDEVRFLGEDGFLNNHVYYEKAKEKELCDIEM